MADEPTRIGTRLLDACLAVLVASMALYGAVTIISAIWKPLCILLAVIGLVSAVLWIFVGRFRRW